MATAELPSHYFSDLYEQWLAREVHSKRVAKIAALAFRKDMQEAIRLRPTDLEQILPSDFMLKKELIQLWTDSSDFVVDILFRDLPTLKHQDRGIVSP